ncbi:hypothetical protein F7R91_41655 [Streptomyces luteolifulvus]|uniref:Uncharacterized protein n=1 Tax=Streptomyces luteolifulvus TaxID=2615112 RepID=A0A643JY66_9ACTN|nr:hypothetical protein [Streptomyces luteolifulvus]KAB1138860.1 hypothetical protein F7R91_41655 [Streptomyces luteolifulvus]
MERTDTAHTAGGGGDEAFPHSEKGEGPISAAIIAAGFGATALGLLTTLAEASESVKDALTWSDDVGPLSGKTSLAVAVWLLAWVLLHAALRNKPYETLPALGITLALIGLGVLGTFPEFFQLFAPE